MNVKLHHGNVHLDRHACAQSNVGLRVVPDRHTVSNTNAVWCGLTLSSYNAI